MISTKPYLVRAIFEWCVDNGLTPYLTVAVGARTRVPREFVRDGQIVLNVGPEATSQLVMGNEEITFQARFSGVAFSVVVPVESVAAIYAKENGQGLAFEATAETDESIAEAAEPDTASELPSTAESGEPPPGTSGGRPHLTRVK